LETNLETHQWVQDTLSTIQRHTMTTELGFQMALTQELSRGTETWIISWPMTKFQEAICSRCFRMNSVKSKLPKPMPSVARAILRSHLKSRRSLKQSKTWQTWLAHNLPGMLLKWRQVSKKSVLKSRDKRCS
jgi:hypothetical protein